MYIRFGITSFRDFHKFVRAGATDGTDKIGGEFIFTRHGEDTVVASILFHCAHSLVSGLAIAAQTCHSQVATFNTAAGEFSGFFAETCGHFDLRQIQNRIAATAEKVDMGCGVGIESLRAVYCTDADDQTLFLEERQIPVDRCL